MKLKLNRKGWIGFASLLAAAALSFAPALPAQGGGQPARAVRLSYVDGKVQLTQGGQSLADQAAINTPLFEGTQISTGDDGKAEIQFEDGSVARLSPASSLTLKTLSTSETDLVLDHGLAYFELQSGSQIGPISVAFGDRVVTVSGFTIVRVNMDTPPGAVAVFSGNAHVEGGMGGSGWSGSIDLHGGENVDFNSADPSNPKLADAIQPDSWDAWNSDRDQALNTASSGQTQAPADLAGSGASNPAWSDLDANGNWYNVPGQGYVWSPYDASNAGFDPYGNGAWVGTQGYGSVWASAYPWGYLPYQCGLWNFYDGFGWGWAPGFGGCSPWWGIGFYGGPRFGILPIGYQPPRRPIRGRGPGGPGTGRPIPVNRTSFRAATDLPARNRYTPVTIAGQTVQALRPMPSRTAYQRPAASTAPRMAPGAGVQGGARSSYVPSRPAYTVTPPSALNRPPQAQRYGEPPAQHYTAPAQRPSAPNYYAPRPAAPPAPAPRSYSAPTRPSAPPPAAASHFSASGGSSFHSSAGRR